MLVIGANKVMEINYGGDRSEIEAASNLLRLFVNFPALGHVSGCLAGPGFRIW